MKNQKNNIIIFDENRDSGDIVNVYFQFLLGRVNCLYDDFTELYRYLHRKEFYSKLALDDNRAADGIDLRRIFIEEYYISDEVNPDAKEGLLDSISGPCTVLEMLVALATRVESFMMDLNKGDHTWMWFKHFIFNLGLDRFDDQNFYKNKSKYDLDGIIETFLDRKYAKNGVGGLFPLKGDVETDQTKVEIWYQMLSWVNQNQEK